jgi:hypothetical protein
MSEGREDESRRPGVQPRRTSGRDTEVLYALVTMAAAAHVLRSRRFYEGLATALIAYCALRELGRQNQATVLERLRAWNRREVQRLERRGAVTTRRAAASPG